MSILSLILLFSGFTMMVWHLLPRGADGDVFFGVSRALRKTYAVLPLEIPDDMMDNIVRLDQYERVKRP